MGSLQAARHRARRRGVPSARQGRLPAGEDELKRRVFLFSAIRPVMVGQKREARLRARCPGHPRLVCGTSVKTWMPGTSPGMTTQNDRTTSPKQKRARQNRARFYLIFDGSIQALPQVEYLNSGIAFSSSLVALNTAWSGYHGLDFGVVAAAGGVFVVAAPVVVDDAGRLPGAFGAPATPV